VPRLQVRCCTHAPTLTHTQMKREKESKKKESDRGRAREPGRDLDTRARTNGTQTAPVQGHGVASVIEECY
jgi:hypothetical protein